MSTQEDDVCWKFVGRPQLSIKNTSGLPLKLEDVIPIKEGTTESTQNVLETMYPEGGPLVNEALLNSTLPNALPADPVIFEASHRSLIKITALYCKGSAGPSGVDAHTWHCMYSSFKVTSASLCDANAGVAKPICTQPVSPSARSSLLPCRLVPRNKNPGVRPIGVGEVAGLIVCKAVGKVVKKDIMIAAGPLHVCSGVEGGCEWLSILLGRFLMNLKLKLPCLWMPQMLLML